MTEHEKQYHPYLSKRLFDLGIHCIKALYLEKYRKDLKPEAPAKKPTPDLPCFDVKGLARRLFPEGVNIAKGDPDIGEQLALTAEEMEKGTEIIWNGAFSHENVFAKTDILCKTEEGRELYLVRKAKIIKDQHYRDAALQCHVLQGAGVPLEKVCVIHINSTYIRKGDIEPEDFLQIEDITKTAKKWVTRIKEELDMIREGLSGDMPVVQIDENCLDGCDFLSFCWPGIPEEDSILAIDKNGWVNSTQKLDYYKRGILQIIAMPRDELNDHRKLFLDAYVKKIEQIHGPEIRDFLATLWYPQYYLDFEGLFLAPIPLFENTLPYQEKIPFQYSLIGLDNEGSEPRSSEYLGQPGVDPRGELVAKLLADVPENACVIVYNATYETGVLENLKIWYPEHTAKIDGIIKNIRDLMAPFKNRHYYHPGFMGGYSQKVVLPALVPGLGYDGLKISAGTVAVDTYLKMYHSRDQGEIALLRKNLLEYCKLDTVGMMKIVQRLREMVSWAWEHGATG